MDFSIDGFYRTNRRILIWAALFFLLWLLRDFFGLVFLIYILTFLAAPPAVWFRRRLKLPHRAATVVVYAGFLLVLISFVRFVVPHVVREANTLVGNLGRLENTLIEEKTEIVERYPSLRVVLLDFLREGLPPETLEEISRGRESAAAPPPEDDLLLHAYVSHQAERLRGHVPLFFRYLWTTTATTLLALLFSFLISIDTVRLRREVSNLKLSRLQDFYEQTAEPVVRFGYVVGRALQAQALIACVNTVLTLAGLWALGVPSLAFLSLIVFVCSFIPVLGVFLSTAPILLVALNNGGFQQALAVVGLVVGVHAVEAYLLNPFIYGRHLKLNPVLVLMILYVGHHAFGIWGMLLGVPVAYYLLHDVFGVPLPGAKKEKEPAGAE
jgi:predicted PurR-regulated permease PerM